MEVRRRITAMFRKRNLPYNVGLLCEEGSSCIMPLYRQDNRAIKFAMWISSNDKSIRDRLLKFLPFARPIYLRNLFEPIGKKGKKKKKRKDQGTVLQGVLSSFFQRTVNKPRRRGYFGGWMESRSLGLFSRQRCVVDPRVRMTTVTA